MAKWIKILSILLTFLVLLWAGIRVTNYKLSVVKKVEFIGHSDETAYATMGRSIVAGRGLEVPYISYYFIPYDPNITRREDHWPPLMGYFIASAYYFLGQDVWVAKVAPIVIGSILLPVLTAALALVYSRRAYVGLIAGGLMLIEPLAFTESLKTLCDVPSAALFTGFCWALLAARKYRWMHLLVGLFIGMAFLCKGSQIILLGLYPVGFWLLCGWDQCWRTKKWIAAGLLVTATLIGPFWYGTYRAYGNPFHSTQNYVSGFIGLGEGGDLGWEQNAYKIYWGKDLPKVTDRWAKYPNRYGPLVARNVECFTRWAILGPSTGFDPDAWDELGKLGTDLRLKLLPNHPPARPPEKAPAPTDLANWTEPLHAIPGLATVIGLPLMLLCAPIIWWWKRRQRPVTSPTTNATNSATPNPSAQSRPLTTDTAYAEKPTPPTPSNTPAETSLLRPTLTLALLVITQWAFLIILWQWLWMNRLSLIFAPIILVLGITFLTRLLELPVQGLWHFFCPKNPTRKQNLETYTLAGLNFLAVLLACYLGLQALSSTPTAQADAAKYGPGWLGSRIKQIATSNVQYGFPWKDDSSTTRYTPTMRMGKYLKANLPNAIVMSRFPWQMMFYAAPTNKAVVIPLDNDAKKILAIARYYHCTHIVRDADWPRPALDPYFRGQRPGFKRIPNTPGNLYEIDWSQFPEVGGTPVSTTAEPGAVGFGPSNTSWVMR